MSWIEKGLNKAQQDAEAEERRRIKAKREADDRLSKQKRIAQEEHDEKVRLDFSQKYEILQKIENLEIRSMLNDIRSIWEFGEIKASNIHELEQLRSSYSSPIVTLSLDFEYGRCQYLGTFTDNDFDTSNAYKYQKDTEGDLSFRLGAQIEQSSPNTLRIFSEGPEKILSYLGKSAASNKKGQPLFKISEISHGVKNINLSEVSTVEADERIREFFINDTHRRISAKTLPKDIIELNNSTQNKKWWKG